MSGADTALHDHLELVRAPAVLSVLGDTLVGRAASGRPVTWRTAMMPLASACLYAGGMALNDYADRELDARERPERPIPSGRITARHALAVATGLTGAGLAIAAAAGGARALAVAVPLAGCIWAYDTVAKEHPSGPVVMAACRGLDVLMGAGVGHLRSALPPAAGIAAHTAAITMVSRGEVHGTTVATAATASTVTAGGAVALLAGAVRRPARQATTTALASAAYVWTCLPDQVAAAREPTGPRARTATRQGVRAMVPLQAAWAARAGSVGSAVFLAGVEIAGRVLRSRSKRKVSET
ncbi:SCO3242 family prenyltransferase [Demequina sp. SO4-18]|uniref:SCO3242 family prenyltransferase n=1 Tax=Demequina sp. SO4-18 TaxID=3401026 RepID=UPI003B5C2894